jgi:hypothetical protein
VIGNVQGGRARFFAYARERHQVYLKRRAGKPQPWTQEPILQEYRFTNVFRELDKTTEWFRKNVRDPLQDSPEVLLATVLFRMLNRIEVGEAVFQQLTMPSGKKTGDTAWDMYLKTGDIRFIGGAIRTVLPKGPYVTGAYIISTPPGKAKLDGALSIVENFRTGSQIANDERAGCYTWHQMGRRLLAEPGKWPLQVVFEWLQQFSYLGSFHSYEIVTDLRHTKLLHRAPDVNTWANIGPGCRRGMNRIMERTRPGDGLSGRKRWGLKIPDSEMLAEMKGLLDASRLQKFWPQAKKPDWPAWEMRDVEHTLCEFDKFERVCHGEGRPRGKFS